MSSMHAKKHRRPQRPLGERCASLAEWLDLSGTSQVALRERLHLERAYPISAGHMCDVVRGSRRPSLRLALELWRVTGVPVERLAEWPRVRQVRNLRADARPKVA